MDRLKKSSKWIMIVVALVMIGVAAQQGVISGKDFLAAVERLIIVGVAATALEDGAEKLGLTKAPDRKKPAP